jgi:hypothetical protein
MRASHGLSAQRPMWSKLHVREARRRAREIATHASAESVIPMRSRLMLSLVLLAAGRASAQRADVAAHSPRGMDESMACGTEHALWMNWLGGLADGEHSGEDAARQKLDDCRAALA